VTGSTPALGPESTRPLTAVDFEHTGNLVALLQQLNVSLLISTYQAGKVVSVGSTAAGLEIRFHHFEQAMGLTRLPTGVAVSSRRQVWTLNAAPDLAPRLPPAGTHDVCFLTRQAHFTGPIMAHDLAWSGGELWVVNTLFSCLCVLQPQFSFVPRWLPPFVSALVSEDRCHLNGLAADERQPRYVTALGETDTAAGWRPGKATGGCLIDVPTRQVLLRGLSMPHSPRLHNGHLWLLDSGHGRLGRYDEKTQRLEVVCELPGYTRGMDCFGRLAFVGLSRIRETSVFGGLPIAERRAALRCGVAIVDLDTGTLVASLLFNSGVEEIFDVKVLPGYHSPVLSGPFPDVDQTETLWLVPPIAVR
jgi:uncharacterized protein (TIGR03032 family)